MTDTTTAIPGHMIEIRKQINCRYMWRPAPYARHTYHVKADDARLYWDTGLSTGSLDSSEWRFKENAESESGG